MGRTSAVAFLIALFGAVVVAQQRKPAFDVASIKPQRESNAVRFDAGPTTAVRPPAPTHRFRPGRVFNETHATVESLIMSAYDLRQYQIVGGPDWGRAEYFQIDARAALDVSVDQLKLMVQSLLKDRFKLTVHEEQRDMNYQALVLARADGRLGPYLLRVGDFCTSDAFGDAKQRLPKRPVVSGGQFFSGCGSGLSGLARALTVQFSAPVIDETQLGGAFFYDLVSAPLGAQTTDPDLPSLMPALEEQLGLKVERRRGPIHVLVIDSVERPTGN